MKSFNYYQPTQIHFGTGRISELVDPFQANIIKYVMRVKGDVAKRIEDLEKAEHYLQKYRELLMERINKMEDQFKQANENSWQLTTLQEAVVRGVATNPLHIQLRELELVSGLMQAYKQILQQEQEQQNDETQAQ